VAVSLWQVLSATASPDDERRCRLFSNAFGFSSDCKAVRKKRATSVTRTKVECEEMQDETAEDEIREGSVMERDGRVTLHGRMSPPFFGYCSEERLVVRVALDSEARQQDELAHGGREPAEEGVHGKVGDEEAVQELEHAQQAEEGQKAVDELRPRGRVLEVRRPQRRQGVPCAGLGRSTSWL
jgi:hypothetical protein